MLSDRRVLALILVAAMGAIVAAGVVVAPRLLGDDTPDAEADAQAFLDAWSDGDLEAMAARIQRPPDTFADDYTAVTEGLDAESATYELRSVRRSGDIAIATFDAHVQVTGVGEWLSDYRWSYVQNFYAQVFYPVPEPAGLPIFGAIAVVLGLARCRVRSVRSSAAGEATLR